MPKTKTTKKAAKKAKTTKKKAKAGAARKRLTPRKEKRGPSGADVLLYEALGVDDFIYYASMGLGQEQQKRSLELFCKEVLPAFA